MSVATGLKPKHGLLSAHPTINGHLLDRIATGHVKVKDDIDRLEEGGVVFKDGTREAADVIMFVLLRRRLVLRHGVSGWSRV